MYRHGLGTRVIERSSMSHMDDVIDMSMSTFATVHTRENTFIGIKLRDHLIIMLPSSI